MNRLRRAMGLTLFLASLLIALPRAFAVQPLPVQLPLAFEPNAGQAPAEVCFLLSGGVLSGEFSADGVSLTLPASKDAASQVRMRLVDASSNATIEGAGKLEGHTSYLLGNDSARWLHALPNYAQVRYRDVYPGTDLMFYGNHRALEHDFVLQPGADPARIAFRLDGAESVTLAANGALQIKLASGSIAFERPIAYQVVNGQRRGVDAAFVLGLDGVVRFHLGSFDASLALVIDPALSYATYLDKLSDGVAAIATDAEGNTYITGYTFNAKYPVTKGAYQHKCPSCANNAPAVYVTKLNAAGTAQVYSTFLGGSNYNQPFGLAVDSTGNAIVTGYTESTDFPLKNPIKSGAPSYMDGFVTSLAPDGASLNFSSRLGGTGSDGTSASTFPGGVAVDASGNVYVTGTTQSPYLPVTPGALDAGTPGYNYGTYVFLTKLKKSGSLAYSALLGQTGDASDCCSVVGVALDSKGNAYVAGTVGVTDFTSTTPWPITAGAYQSAMISPGDTAPFAAKVSADGSKLLYSTLVTTGEASAMVLTSGNQMILTGSPNYNYPVTSNAYSATANSIFIAELSADGSQLPYSSYFGGQQEYSGSGANALALDASGNIWLAGYTGDSTFPLVNPLVAQLPAYSMGSSVTSFLSEFDPTGKTLKFSTFIGDLSGSGLQIAFDTAGKIHAAGTTTAPIYTTPGAFIGTVPAAPSGGEYTYPYALLIDPSVSSPTLCLGNHSNGLWFGYLMPPATLTQTVQVTNCGSAPLTIHSIKSSNSAFTIPSSSNGCTGAIAVGSSCSVGVKFAPKAAQSYAGQLTFTSNASVAKTAISLSGTGAYPVAAFGPRGGTESLNFQPLLVGQTSPVEYIRFYNIGPVSLTINLSKVAVSGDFALATGSTCTTTLPADSYCMFAIVFKPTAAGARTGQISVPSNDPVNPVVSAALSGTAYTTYPVATITALLNPSYPLNSVTTPIAVSVEGTNFFPASVVYVNGVAQTTTYSDSSYLSFNLNPSVLKTAGQIPVTVVNPSPGGGKSASYPLLVYLSIPLTASALAVDPVGGLLYAAIPSSATSNPNTVIPINPSTGATLTPIAVSNNPQTLAISDDGSKLYVASTGTLQRINLKTKAIEKTFKLPVDSEWGQTYVQEMHVVPGSPKSIVVELFANVDPAEDGAALYNDSGLVNWLPGVGADSKNMLEIDSFAFTSASAIYAIPAYYGTSFFDQLQVSASGLASIGGGKPSGTSSTVSGNIVRSDGTLLYTNTGQVWNPKTQKLLGTYLESDGGHLFNPASVLPDAANKRTYFLDSDAQYAYYQSLNIDIYDQSKYGLLGRIPFLAIYPPDASDLVRWGSNGFAFRSVDTTGYDASANQIVIVTSSLVTKATGAPLPILASVSPSPVKAGGPAYTMQLAGTGFTRASTVLVNGAARATTYISGTSLSAAVLASDIAQAGQLNVQVTTPAPGGGTSNLVYVGIDTNLAAK